MNKRDVILCGASAVTASTLAVLLYRYLSRRTEVYETDKLVHEYLMFHYGKPKEVLSYNYGPKDALDFPQRCAHVCSKYAEVSDL